jgi:hypothetical protein
MNRQKRYTGLDFRDKTAIKATSTATLSPSVLVGIAVAVVVVPTATVLVVLGASGFFDGHSDGGKSTEFCDWRGATAPLAANATSPPPATVLVSGQSNAVGVFYRCPNYTKIGTSHLHMDGEWNTLGVGASGYPFGPELGASEVVNGTMAKVALGGASIVEFLPGGSMFPQIVATPLSQHCVLFWVQGETDAANAILADQYAERFRSLRSEIQTQSSCSNLFIVSALLRPNEFGHMPCLETVNQALRNNSDAIVETRGLTLSDHIHYDGPSTLQLGRDLANAYFNLM